jgi:uncharacterized repeat protein (TIGR03803 family)
VGGVTGDSNGDLYTSTQTGGSSSGPGYGTVDEFNKNGTKWSESTLHVFKGSEGSSPYAAVTFDGAGTIYGTTRSGGSTYGSGCNTNGCGAVFTLTHGSHGWSESVLYSFTDGADGGYPQGPVTFDKSGNLYGTTSGGGNASCPLLGGCGTVFELARSSGWKQGVVHAFGGTDGEYPYTRLAIDSHGNIFGTTPQGGSGCGTLGCGVVYEISGTGSSRTTKVIHAFTNGSDGGAPEGGLIADSKGNLYGTTSGGGSKGFGVAYKLSRSGASWKEKVLFNFSLATVAESPSGELVFDAHGNLFGVAAGGSSTGGWSPNGGLLVNDSGQVFGTTLKAHVNGAGCCGAVYELLP